MATTLQLPTEGTTFRDVGDNTGSSLYTIKNGQLSNIAAPGYTAATDISFGGQTYKAGSALPGNPHDGVTFLDPSYRGKAVNTLGANNVYDNQNGAGSYDKLAKYNIADIQTALSKGAQLGTASTFDINTDPAIAGVQNPNQANPVTGAQQSPAAQAAAQPTQPAPTPFGSNYGPMGVPNASPTPGTPTQPTQATTQAANPPLTMPANGSVVDLLAQAGVDNSFAARQQLATQFGISQYSGTAQQNEELAQDFLAKYNQVKGTAVPQTGAEARTAIGNLTGNQQTPAQQNPQGQFFDAVGSLNPIENQLFTQMSQLMNTQQTQTSLADTYAQQTAAAGIPALQTQLLNLQTIMQGTSSDIANEISKSGGWASSSQVAALADSRNRVLMQQADLLQNQIALKQDYVNQIVQLTGQDRAEVDKQVDQKLNIGKTLFDMSQTMTNAARDNYSQIIQNIGYNGLVDSISSPQELAQVAQTLGMSSQTLLQLGSQPTSAQKQMQLQEQNYQLSVDKFNEDKKEFGLQYALDQQKVATQNIATATISPYQKEQSQRSLDTITDLLPKVSNFTTGGGSLLANIPGTDARNFQAEVETLKSNIAFNELTAMRDASKSGGALGQISDREESLLSATLGALDTAQSPSQFKSQLLKVQDNLLRWDNEVSSLSKDFDYQGAKKEGYSEQEIYDFLNK